MNKERLLCTALPLQGNSFFFGVKCTTDRAIDTSFVTRKSYRLSSQQRSINNTKYYKGHARNVLWLTFFSLLSLLIQAAFPSVR